MQQPKPRPQAAAAAFSIVDQCPNISGFQLLVPFGKVKNNVGNCVNWPPLCIGGELSDANNDGVHDTCTPRSCADEGKIGIWPLCITLPTCVEFGLVGSWPICTTPPVDVCTDLLNPGNQPVGTTCITDACTDELNPGDQPFGTVCITDACTDELNPGDQPFGTVCITDACTDELNPGDQEHGTTCITDACPDELSPGDQPFGSVCNVPMPQPTCDSGAIRLGESCPPSCGDLEWTDINQNQVIDEGECQATVAPPTEPNAPITCPAGSAWNDVNANAIVDSGECAAVAGEACPAGDSPITAAGGGNYCVADQCPDVAGLQETSADCSPAEPALAGGSDVGGASTHGPTGGGQNPAVAGESSSPDVAGFASHVSQSGALPYTGFGLGLLGLAGLVSIGVGGAVRSRARRQDEIDEPDEAA